MLQTKVDYSLAGIPRYYMADEEERPMQIPDEIRKSVAFVCFRDKNDNEKPKYAGTAFFIVVSTGNMGFGFGYVVTAKHVIDGIRQNCIDNSVLLRINTKDGGNILIDIPISEWKFHPNDSSVDVATLPFTIKDYDVKYIPIEMAVTDQIIKDKQIDIGDEVFLTGLFVNHTGEHRNLPILRVGNIALMPEEPIKSNKLGDIQAYLIEARSIGGLSGSPVFVYIGRTRMLENSYTVMGVGPVFYWLGLMHGHWDGGLSDTDILLEDASIEKGVNRGIAIVIPAIKILEVINQKEFRDIRDEAIKKEKEKGAPVMDS